MKSEIQYKLYPQFYVIAVDLGSVQDSTAISVIEVQKEIYPANMPQPRNTELHYLVHNVHRPRLGTEYSKVIDQVASIRFDLLEHQRKWPYDEKYSPPTPIVVWDGTGLGAVVVQSARKVKSLQTSLSLTITGGNVGSLSGLNWNVPKGHLVGTLRLAMQNRRVHVAQFPERDVLMNELQVFTAKISSSGRATFMADGDQHDDCVLSLSMATLAARQRYEGAISLIEMRF